jgi:hypothetical protein
MPPLPPLDEEPHAASAPSVDAPMKKDLARRSEARMGYLS